MPAKNGTLNLTFGTVAVLMLVVHYESGVSGTLCASHHGSVGANFKAESLSWIWALGPG